MRLSRSYHRAFVMFSVLAASVCAAEARATEPGKNPYVELLEDPFPSATAPFEPVIADYVWRGTEKLPTGSRAEWIGSETQWTRISERLVLPRARVRIVVPSVEGVLVFVQGRAHAPRNESGTWVAEVNVPLVSGPSPAVSVQFRRGDAVSLVPLFLDRRPPPGSPDRIELDPSCSPSRLAVAPLRESGPGRSAAFFAHCRLVRSEAARGLSGTLDVLFWIDGAGNSVRVNGNPLAAESPSIFRVQIDPTTASLRIDSPTGESFTMTAKVPERVNRGFFGLGIGPYRYRLLAPETDVSTMTGILTLYGSYQMTDSVRLTAFNATTLHRNFFTDTGFYVKSDSARFFDQRVTVYLMLGANVVGFRYGGRTRMKAGAPQGFEAVYHDFARKNRSLIVGAFIYPPIDGKSYYNTWIRYGASAFFGELNYLSIRDRFDDRAISSRSVGVSVGFPLARFF